MVAVEMPAEAEVVLVTPVGVSLEKRAFKLASKQMSVAKIDPTFGLIAGFAPSGYDRQKIKRIVFASVPVLIFADEIFAPRKASQLRLVGEHQADFVAEIAADRLCIFVVRSFDECRHDLVTRQVNEVHAMVAPFDIVFCELFAGGRIGTVGRIGTADRICTIGKHCQFVLR